MLAADLQPLETVRGLRKLDVSRVRFLRHLPLQNCASLEVAQSAASIIRSPEGYTYTASLRVQMFRIDWYNTVHLEVGPGHH